MDATPPDDRRQEGRYVSVLRVCCIEASDGMSFALLRNISTHGAQIESDIPDPVGAPVSYFFDDSFRIEAEIAWKKDGKIGLSNRTSAAVNTQSFPRRALRVPISQPAKVWVNGKASQVNVANISQTGALLEGEFDLRNGALMTLKLGKVTLENTTVKWSSATSAGVKFERPLHMRQLKQIVEDRRKEAKASPPAEAPADTPAGPLGTYRRLA